MKNRKPEVPSVYTKTAVDDRLLALEDVIGNKKKGVVGYLPMSRSAWGKGRADGRFPKPTYLDGNRKPFWRLSQILSLVQGSKESQS